MKALVLIIASGAVLVGIALTEHTRSDRWKVKTLADGFHVDTVAVATTIADQAAVPCPKVGEDVKRLPSEKTLYSLTARLVEAKKEFDGDYHLILEDPASHLRMIAEIPDTTAAASPVYRQDFARARTEITKLLGRKPGFLGVHPVGTCWVQVEGIGFFDEPHIFAPTGTAPNDREIHPVLHIQSLASAPVSN
ncbi:MAG TPA: hypothetical protein VGM92_15195 [Candidatus Kapabacteria bacterium]